MTASEKETLLAVLPYVKFAKEGVDKKPTIQFSGVNVQVVSGSGATNGAVNGEGNLVVGYDEKPGAQTGSNNIVLGYGQSYTSFGGLIGGSHNAVTGNFGVAFGESNKVSGYAASVCAAFISSESSSLSTARPTVPCRAVRAPPRSI